MTELKRIQGKLEQGINLTEQEIRNIVYEEYDGVEKVYERKYGFDFYPSRMLDSVYKIGENLYAIEWFQHQGEHTPDHFPNQPHKCKLETKMEKFKRAIVENIEDESRKKEVPYNLSTVEKLEQGYALSEDEICDLAYGNIKTSKEVYEEEGECFDYLMTMLTIQKINNRLYAIEWYKALEEHAKSIFENQPYECKIEEFEEEVENTYIHWHLKRNRVK